MGPREFYEQLPSTQDRALALARAGAPDGTRVVARRQTLGRGRADHRWVSPVGGLYLSIVLRTTSGPSPLLPLGIGAGLAERLAAQFSVPLRTKWPNDLLVVSGPSPARKIGGVLTDRLAADGSASAAVAGIGLNVDVPPIRLPPELAPTTASLSEFVRPPPSLEVVEEVVVASVLETSRQLSAPGGPRVVLERCRRTLYGLGRHARVDGRPVGTITGLGPDGSLAVEADGVPAAVVAGDLAIQDGS